MHIRTYMYIAHHIYVVKYKIHICISMQYCQLITTEQKGKKYIWQHLGMTRVHNQ